MNDNPQPVYGRVKRSAFDQRMNYLRYSIAVALYGPHMLYWPQHAHW